MTLNKIDIINEERCQSQCEYGAQDFGRNFANDPTVKIPWVRPDLCGGRVLVMEWIDGLRCTDPAGIRASGLDVSQFIRCGVVSGLRQLLEVSPPRARYGGSVSFVQAALFIVCYLQEYSSQQWNRTKCFFLGRCLQVTHYLLVVSCKQGH